CNDKGVPVTGHANCAGAFRTADFFRNLSISPDFAVRNGQQGLPNLFLECCAPKKYWKGKFLPASFQIFLELPKNLLSQPGRCTKVLAVLHKMKSHYGPVLIFRADVPCVKWENRKAFV